ncbi:MAG: hypothetical protein Q9172_001627 [Xanthocarpia lactea]
MSRPFRPSGMVDAARLRQPPTGSSQHEQQTQDVHSDESSSESDDDASVPTHSRPIRTYPSPPSDDQACVEQLADTLLSIRGIEGVGGSTDAPMPATTADDEQLANTLLSIRGNEAAREHTDAAMPATAPASRKKTVERDISDDDTDAVEPESDQRIAAVRCQDGSSGQIFASATSAVWELSRERRIAESNPGIAPSGDGAASGDGPQSQLIIDADDTDDNNDPKKDRNIGSLEYNFLSPAAPVDSADPDAHVDNVLDIRRPATYHTVIKMLQSGICFGGKATICDPRNPKQSDDKTEYSVDALRQMRGDVPVRKVDWVTPPRRPEFECELVVPVSKAEERRGRLAASRKNNLATMMEGEGAVAGPSSSSGDNKKKKRGQADVSSALMGEEKEEEEDEQLAKRPKVAASSPLDLENGTSATSPRSSYPTPRITPPGKVSKTLAGSGMRAPTISPKKVEEAKGGKEVEAAESSAKTTRSGRTVKKRERLMENNSS